MADDNLQFESELSWCLEQLRLNLESKKMSDRHGEKALLCCLQDFGIQKSRLISFATVKETINAIKVLQSSNAPLVKKRQVMRLSLGDYRAKMSADEKKLRIGTSYTRATK